LKLFVTNTTFQEIRNEFSDDLATLVGEVTDDKSLNAGERKRLQIEHVTHASDRAKLIKMADKLHNMRDLVRLPPPGWNEKRIQGYFVWSSFVTRACKGVNPYLDSLLEDFYCGTFTYEGIVYPILPDGDLHIHLENYLTMMSQQ